MNRRELLASFGVGLGSVSLGGCLGQSGGVGGAGETTDGTTTDDTSEETTTGETTTDGAGDETTEETTETTAGGPNLTDEQFEVTGTGCGEPSGEADVDFRTQSGTVAVTGAIPGSNQCYTADLADASYDPDAGAFVVTVASMQKEGSEACAQCITQIDYEATFTFEGDLPDEVSVVHEAMGDSTPVVTAGASESAAGPATGTATTTRTGTTHPVTAPNGSETATASNATRTS